MEEHHLPEEEGLEEAQAEEAESEQESEPLHQEARPSLIRALGVYPAFRETIETVLLAVLIILLVNSTTGRFRVLGFSMEPTLHDGQYIIVSRVVYMIHAPERGDVVVLRAPHNIGGNYIVKRIVGLPGERVEIRDGKVLVNGMLLEEPYIAEPGLYSGTWILGSDEYFVLGDNRRNSSDSHNGGVFTRKDIVGKAWLCYWPPEDWGRVRHHAFTEAEP